MDNRSQQMSETEETEENQNDVIYRTPKRKRISKENLSKGDTTKINSFPCVPSGSEAEQETLAAAQDAEGFLANISAESQQLTEYASNTAARVSSNMEKGALQSLHKKIKEYQLALEQRDSMIGKLQMRLAETIQQQEEIHKSSQEQAETFKHETDVLKLQLQQTIDMVTNQKTGVNPRDHLDLKNKLISLQQDRVHNEQLLQELTEQLKCKSDSYGQLDYKYKQLLQKYKIIQGEHEKTNTEVQLQKTQKMQQEGELETLRSRCKELEKECLHFEENMKAAQGDNIKCREEIQELMLQLQGLASALNQKEEEIRFTRERAEEHLGHQLTLIKQQMSEIHSEEITKIKKSHESEIALVTQQIDSLQKSHDTTVMALKDTVTSLKTQNAHLQEELNNNVQYMQQMNMDKEFYSNKCYELDTQKAEISRELKVLKDSNNQHIQEIQMQLNESVNKVSEREKQYAELETTVGEREKQYTELKNKFGEREKQYAELENKAGEREKQCTELEKKAGEREKQYTELKNKFGEREKQYAELENKAGEREKQCTELEKKVGEREKQYAELEIIYNDLVKEREDLLLQKESLLKEKENYLLEMKILQKSEEDLLLEKVNLQKEKEETLLEIEVVQKEKQEWHSEREALRNENINHVELLNIKTEEYRVEIENRLCLEERVKILLQEHETLKLELTGAKSQLEERAQCETQMKTESESSITNLKEEIEKLNIQLQKEAKMRLETEHKFDQINNTIEGLKEENVKLTSQMVILEKEKEDMINENRILMNKNESVNHKNMELVSSVAELEADKTALNEVKIHILQLEENSKKIEEEYEARCHILNEKIFSMDEKLKEAQNLHLEFDSTTLDNIELKKKLDEKNNAFKQLEGKLASVEAELGRLDETCKALERMNLHMTEELKMSEEKFYTTEKELRIAQEHLEKSKNELGLIQEKFSATERELELVKRRNEKVEGDFLHGQNLHETIKVELSRVQEKCEKVVQELEYLQSKYDGTEKELFKTQQKSKAIEAELNQVREKCDTVEKDKGDIELERDRLMDQYRMMEAELSSTMLALDREIQLTMHRKLSDIGLNLAKKVGDCATQTEVDVDSTAGSTGHLAKTEQVGDSLLTHEAHPVKEKGTLGQAVIYREEDPSSIVRVKDENIAQLEKRIEELLSDMQELKIRNHHINFALTSLENQKSKLKHRLREMENEKKTHKQNEQQHQKDVLEKAKYQKEVTELLLDVHTLKQVISQQEEHANHLINVLKDVDNGQLVEAMTLARSIKSSLSSIQCRDNERGVSVLRELFDPTKEITLMNNDLKEALSKLSSTIEEMDRLHEEKLSTELENISLAARVRSFQSFKESTEGESIHTEGTVANQAEVVDAQEHNQNLLERELKKCKYEKEMNNRYLEREIILLKLEKQRIYLPKLKEQVESIICGTSLGTRSLQFDDCIQFAFKYLKESILKCLCKREGSSKTQFFRAIETFRINIPDIRNVSKDNFRNGHDSSAC
ncbi:hypothetical protein SK128_001745 [Halocaridina rubra]|uniref:Uncharacterized protein n=1 Tax=Halocaridina rubra TaxID=373956 RepID=A0AAN8X3U2_HALRR